MAEDRRVVRAAGVIGFYTLLSRIFGLVRDAVIANFFEARGVADAWVVAFKIPNTFRRLFGEGSLTASFIPVYTESLNKDPREESDKIAHISMTISVILLIILSVTGVVLAPLLVRVIAPGYLGVSEKFILTVSLTKWMFPYIFFIGLVALCMGILNSLRHFTAPALAPVLLNLSLILSTLLLYNYFAQPVYALALGVLIGGITQLALQIPFLYRVGVRPKINFSFFHPAIGRIFKLMVPAILGLAVYQINTLVSTFFASRLPGGNTYLYFADRLIQFPLGVFAIAIATAALPSLSRLAADNRMEELMDTLNFSLRLAFFVAIPAMVGLIIIRVPILNVLFQRGKFDFFTVRMTAQAVLFFALGLWAFSGVRIIVSAFYSLKDMKTPVYVAIVALLTNIILCKLLVGPLEHGGLALAISLSSAINMLLLLLILRRRFGTIGAGKILGSIFKAVLSSLLMGGLIYWLSGYGEWTVAADDIYGLVVKAGRLLGVIVVGTGVYLASCYLLKNSELSFLLEGLRRRLKGTGDSGGDL
ncbi:MAG: murein biosynthesis integral membrane protein MurJ [Deltaproteobacteria bacterium]|nr:MAG: murein biosynthesis integral membrane protein MurJ [Deltaproteobacteria bacterium]